MDEYIVTGERKIYYYQSLLKCLEAKIPLAEPFSREFDELMDNIWKVKLDLEAANTKLATKRYKEVLEEMKQN